MKKALALVAMLAVASFVSAQTVAELDLDGVYGNGPDYIIAEVSDYILVDVYISAPFGILSFGVDIANYDGSLEYQGCTYSVPSGWTATPPVPGPKITVQATDFTFNNPIVVYPYKVATVEYHAAVDGSIDDLAIVLHGWFNTQMLSGVFDEVIGGTVQIGSAGAEESSWGAVKGLFR